jgi:hypothetical protein
MNELKMRGVKGDARDSALRRFRRVVLSVADDRMADRRKLHSDLVLQSRHQRNPDQRSGPKRAFHGIAKFRASRLGAALRGQSLKHSFPSQVVNQRPFLGAGLPANHREILPHRSMGEKLADQRVSIRLGLGKEQNPGRKPVDAMDDENSLSLPSPFGGKERKSGRSIGAWHRHSRKSGRLIDGHNGIVFVKYDQRSLHSPGSIAILPVSRC